MKKVFIVLRTHRDIIGGYPVCNDETDICGAFDSEDKAINCIRDEISADHYEVDKHLPRPYKAKKYAIPDVIRQNEDVTAYETYVTRVPDCGYSYAKYKYITCDVK